MIGTVQTIPCSSYLSTMSAAIWTSCPVVAWFPACVCRWWQNASKEQERAELARTKQLTMLNLPPSCVLRENTSAPPCNAIVSFSLGSSYHPSLAASGHLVFLSLAAFPKLLSPSIIHCVILSLFTVYFASSSVSWVANVCEYHEWVFVI